MTKGPGPFNEEKPTAFPRKQIGHGGGESQKMASDEGCVRGRPELCVWRVGRPPSVPYRPRSFISDFLSSLPSLSPAAHSFASRRRFDDVAALALTSSPSHTPFSIRPARLWPAVQ